MGGERGRGIRVGAWVGAVIYAWAKLGLMGLTWMGGGAGSVGPAPTSTLRSELGSTECRVEVLGAVKVHVESLRVVKIYIFLLNLLTPKIGISQVC